MATYRFAKYFTGEPLVGIEYSYDQDALTMTEVRTYPDGTEKVTTAEITDEQRRTLDQLSYTDQMRAASVFAEADYSFADSDYGD